MGSHLTNQKHKYSRRLNGLQLPLNYLQVFGWLVFIVTALLNFVILVEIQFDSLKLASVIVYIILYGFHVITHIFAMCLDPSEEELRKRESTEVPEFDRHLHAHVIENGRCHLCNIYSSDKKTKHCGICNKCVYRFDHHCKWLNNCIGERNYSAFIGCVTTALFISVFTFSLCLIDIVMFFDNPLNFEATAYNLINCTHIEGEINLHNCRNYVYFIIFLIIYLVCSSVITCALLHLLCFHIYINLLGMSTYEYIINKRSPCKQYFQMPDLFLISKKNHKPTDLIKNEPGVSNLVSIIVNYELETFKKLLHYNNKIHPAQVPS